MSADGIKKFDHFESSTVGLKAVPSPELGRIIGNTVAGGDRELSTRISEAALQLFSYHTNTIELPLDNDYDKHGAGDYFRYQRYRQSLLQYVQPKKIPLLGAEIQGSIGITRSGNGASIGLTMKPLVTERERIVATPMYRTEAELQTPDLRMFINIPERILPEGFSTEMALNSLRVYLLELQREHDDALQAAAEEKAREPRSEPKKPLPKLFLRQVTLQRYGKGKLPVMPFQEPLEIKSALKKAV